MIHHKRFAPWLVAGLLVLPVPVLADDLDVTMRMVEDSEDLTNSVTREIRLPELPALQGKANGQGRGRQDAPGREASEGARERGREFGRSMSEQAREAREKKPELQTDRLPKPAREVRDQKPDMPPQSSRP
jgi:hypothetical protein